MGTRYSLDCKLHIKGPHQGSSTEQEIPNGTSDQFDPGSIIFAPLISSEVTALSRSSSLWLDPADRCVGTWRQGDFVFHQNGGKVCLTHDSERETNDMT